MTTDILLCNFDPAWDFVHWAHHHALDVFARPAVALWQIEAPTHAGSVPPSAASDPWGDWPRRLPPATWADELAEHQEVHRHTAHCWLFNLPALAEAPLRALLTALSAALPTEAPHRYLVTLPAATPAAFVLAEEAAARFDHRVLLPEVAEPEERGYALRLLVELIRDPALGVTLDRVRRTRIVTLTLEADPSGGRWTDTVSHYWPPQARALLDLSQRLRGPGLGAGLTAWKAAFDSALQHIETLCAPQGEPHARLEDSRDSTLEQRRSPWFFAPRLADELADDVTRFYAQLDATLEQRFVSLNTNLQHTRQRHLDQEPAFQAALLAHTASTLGLSERARSTLAEQQVALDDRRQALITEEQAVLERLRDELTPETRQGTDLFGGANRHYRRPHLAEDAALHQAQQAAQHAAQALGARRSAVLGLSVVLGLALLPLLALHGPAGSASSADPAFAAIPAFGGLDLAWVGLFVGLYLGMTFFSLQRRHRALRRALGVLKMRADQARQRHHQALDQTFRYQHLILALQRLVQVAEHLARVRDELAAALLDLSRLETVLTEHGAYFARGARVTPPESGTVAAALLARVEGHPPRAWLRQVLHDWPVEPPETVEVRDPDFNQPGRGSTTFLRGGIRLTFTRALAGAPCSPPHSTTD